MALGISRKENAGGNGFSSRVNKNNGRSDQIRLQRYERHCVSVTMTVWYEERGNVVRPRLGVVPEIRIEEAENIEGKALQDVVVIVQWTEPNNKSRWGSPSSGG